MTSSPVPDRRQRIGILWRADRDDTSNRIHPLFAPLAERFAKAVAACRKRHELGALLAETRAEYDARASEAETLLSSDDTGAAAARWQSLIREARGHASVLNNASRPAPEIARPAQRPETRGIAPAGEAGRMGARPSP